MSNDNDQDKLNAGQQLTNLMLGADFLLRIILSVPWTIQLWIVQASRAKAKGQRFIPQLPKSILFYDPGCRAQDILSAYHIHNMHFGAALEDGSGAVELVHAVLVPATQFDYADAILQQHGIAILSAAGNKRGYSMHQPRDYGQRTQRQQPRQNRHRQNAKLGKTYN